MRQHSSTYLPGLNTLRFIAAFFVVISHANISLYKLGVYKECKFAFLNRGGDAVDFFFTLSGFLITYLLINEIKETNTISISQFYMRRVLRIWPLYFLIIIIGFILLGYVYPLLYQKPFFQTDIVDLLLMFVFFIPNFAAKNYMVGLLNPLWSIGVEEQFYIFWAPMVKWFKKYVFTVVLIFLIFSTVFYCSVSLGCFNIGIQWKNFFLSQKFYTMATGGLFACLVSYHLDIFSILKLNNKFAFLAVLFLLLWHYLIGFHFSDSLFFKMLLPYLYATLIFQVSFLPPTLINWENNITCYLGIISYGIYMYHMVVDYLLRMFYTKIFLSWSLPSYLVISIYYVLILLLTIFISSVSYKYFESFFLSLKNKKVLMQ
jgi:peptidoglycan/LPS O-acetylase OafA/YrhL